MQRYFPQAEYDARWVKVGAELKRRGLATAVIWGRSGGNYERCSDVLYLTGYYGTGSGQGLDTPLTTARSFASVIFAADETPELMADDPGPNPALLATDRVGWSRNTIQGTADVLKRRGVKGPVALVGSDFLPMKYWAMLQAATPGIEWRIEDDLVRTVRLIKSPRELAALRHGGETVSRALTKLVEGLLVGKSEAEAAGEAAREVVRGGGHVHMIPVSHGDLIHYFVRDPLAGYSHDKPKDGDLVRGWVYGPMFQGYWLDPGRTAVTGRRPTNSQKDLVEACANVVDTLIAGIKPGVLLADLAREGDRLIQAAGGEKDQAAEKFPLYGHGLGLFFEKPYISTSMGEAGDVFQEGMVMGVEAFLARSGVGAAGFEQNVIVGKDGAELLTTTPMLWW
ncbi:MAG: aminopeptidase P family protein [Alphaproteobacteria bacterium]|nr:aminopeptidase P family protein [Alphaproteobacteria bacterium]